MCSLVNLYALSQSTRRKVAETQTSDGATLTLPFRDHLEDIEGRHIFKSARLDNLK